MAYPNISLNGTVVSAISLSGSGGNEFFQTGDTPRAIDDSLVDLGFSQKDRFSFSLKVGSLRSWLKALKALPSFVFLDFEGNSYTVKMTTLSFSWIYAPGSYVQTAQIVLEEV